MRVLTIGKVARKAGVGIETIRFYERQGLIESPPRTESGYRQYPEESVFRLSFIKRAKELGFSLNEIKELLYLRQKPDATKADIKQRAEAKIEDIKQKIKDLTRIKDALEHITEMCDGHGPLDECPILDALDCQEECEH